MCCSILFVTKKPCYHSQLSTIFEAAHETVLDDLADGAAELHERSVVLAAADTYSSSAEDRFQDRADSRRIVLFF